MQFAIVFKPSIRSKVIELTTWHTMNELIVEKVGLSLAFAAPSAVSYLYPLPLRSFATSHPSQATGTSQPSLVMRPPAVLVGMPRNVVRFDLSDFEHAKRPGSNPCDWGISPSGIVTDMSTYSILVNQNQLAIGLVNIFSCNDLFKQILCRRYLQPIKARRKVLSLMFQ